MEAETNLDELVKANVDAITDALPSLTSDQLTQLHDIEAAGRKRTTLMEAIHREQKAREDKAGETGGEQSGGDQGATDQGGDDAAKGAPADGSAIYTQANVDSMLAAQDERHKAEIDALHADYAARAAQSSESPFAGAGMANTFERGEDAMQADLATLRADRGELILSIDGVFVVLVDDEGRAMKDLPPLEMAASMFKRSAGSLTLDKKIELPAALPAAEIAGAVLVEDDDDGVDGAIARATLVQPFSVGGGRVAELPAGTLAFTR